MCRRNSYSVLKRFLANREQIKIFAAVVVIKLVTCSYLVAKAVLFKAACYCKLYSLCYRLSLGLCRVEKFFIFLGIIKCFGYCIF